MPEQPADLNVNVNKKGTDTWRIVERIGIAVILLFFAGNHFFKQDTSKQDFIQQTATDNSAAIKEQARLDREKEKMQAQFIQEKLISVVESQVAATVEATTATKESRASIEQTGKTNIQVAESLSEFNETAKSLVDRVDRLVDRVEEPK